MITKAIKTGGVSTSVLAAWRIVGDLDPIEGMANNITITQLDIVEVPKDLLPVTPTREDVRRTLDGMILEGDLTAEEVEAIAALYPAGVVGEDVAVDDLRSYRTTIYRVIQAHKTQDGRTPDVTQALWVKAVPDNVIPDWVQPTGAYDAYNTGDKVSFDGAVYESLINENVWSPTAYPQGWKQL